jgi:diguanylate cyclase (GGDEF)-like protein
MTDARAAATPASTRRAPGAAPQRPSATALLAAVWTALYMLGMGYSDAFMVGPSQVTLFWPAAGVAFAAVVGLGYRWAATIPVAVLIAHATFAQVPPAFVPFSVLGNLFGALAGAHVVRRVRTRHAGSTGGAFAVSAGALVMAVLAAGIGTLGLIASGMVPLSAAVPAYVKWVLGDLLGIACIAPTLLLLIRRHSAHEPDAPRAGDYAPVGQKAAWAVMYVVSYAFVYWAGVQNSAYALGMVAFPLALLLWSAFRLEPLWTALGTLVAVFVVTSLTGLGLAAFQAPRTLLDVVLLLGFLNLFALLPMVLMASIHDQRIAARRALRVAAQSAEAQQVELERLVAERTRQLDEANRALEHASQTDPLTGLRNRRYLARQLPLDLAFYRRGAAESPDSPHALVFALVDIDHFKRINDRFGHKAGDEVLQQFGARLTALVRSGDYAVRWGGEEFLLVLRPMASEHVATLGERICRSVSAEPFHIEGHPPLTVTCSTGFAECRLAEPDGALSWEPLVELADAALYWMKRHGRNGWAALHPADGATTAVLAERAGEGAQALVDAGVASVLTGTCRGEAGPG